MSLTPIDPDLPTISSLWVGNRLRWYDRLGLASFRAQGHRVKLYSYAPVENIPEDIETADANEIFEPSQELFDQTAPAYIADIFRIFLMSKTDEVWCDTDLICVKPITWPEHRFIAGRTGERNQVNNAVMRLPHGSATLALLHQAVTDPEFVPPWLRPRGQNRVSDIPPENKLVGMYKERRIILGPMAITHGLLDSGEFEHCAQQEVFSPVYWTLADLPFNSKPSMEFWMTEKTCTVHLWSSLMRAHHKSNPPHSESFIGQALQSVGLEFEKPE
ncbi:MAG: hypothetical protein GKR98_08745 [Boseongicola sp.]|nr:MAG: hypothetical protein GKR98_08745 [Boseongicola sp.]